MTAQELIAFLQTLPSDTPVVLSRDAEGNGYSPLACAQPAHYQPETTWRGDLADEDEGLPHNAAVLWPVG